MSVFSGPGWPGSASRYFMEHPHGRAGFLRSRRIFELCSSFRKQFNHPGVPLAPVLRPSDEQQSRHGLLNTAMTFKLHATRAMLRRHVHRVALAHRLGDHLARECRHGNLPNSSNL